MTARRIANQWLRDILVTLYRDRTVTRAEIIRRTGLNPASLTHALQYLLDRGVVLKVGALQSTGGRRRELLKLDTEAAYFVVVDLEGTRIRFALTNFIGDIRYSWAEDIAVGHQLESKKVVDGIKIVLGSLNKDDHSRVLAIGVSHAGFSDPQGRVTAFNLGWRGIPLAKAIRRHFDLPLFLEPVHRTYILAERWLGIAKNCNNCIYLMFGSGVGIGGFVDGKLLTGFNQLAGELGHITVDPTAEDICRCGKRGCLEAIVSSPNIVRQYQALTRRSNKTQVEDTVAKIFDKARVGDTAAVEVVNRVVKYLGLAISYLVHLFDPELIVVGGDIMYGRDLLLRRLKDQALSHISQGIPHKFDLQLSSLGVDIGLKGSASLAFHRSILDAALLRKICTPVSARLHPIKQHEDR